MKRISVRARISKPLYLHITNLWSYSVITEIPGKSFAILDDKGVLLWFNYNEEIDGLKWDRSEYETSKGESK